MFILRNALFSSPFISLFLLIVGRQVTTNREDSVCKRSKASDAGAVGDPMPKEQAVDTVPGVPPRTSVQWRI
jgi:hypothetical protein